MCANRFHRFPLPDTERADTKWGRSIRDFPNRTANAAIRAALIVSVGETGNSRTLTASAGGRCHCFTHCGSSPSAHPIFAENCGKHTNATLTLPSSHGASLLPFLGHRGPRALDAVSLGAPGRLQGCRGSTRSLRRSTHRQGASLAVKVFRRSASAE